MTRKPLTNKDINWIRDQLQMEGETKEFIAEEVKRLKELHGWEGNKMQIKLIYDFERKDYTVYFDEALIDIAKDLAEVLQTFLAHVTDVEVGGDGE